MSIIRFPVHARSLRVARRVLGGALIAVALVLAGTVAGTAGGCLRGGEMRQAIASGEAIPLGALRGRLGGGKIVRADLCRGPGGLVYRVAVLRGAKVDELVIDARSGQVISRR